MNVAIAVVNGVTDAGLAIALDVFRATNALALNTGRRAPFVVSVCSRTGRRVRSASGLSLAGLSSFAEASRADALVVPGRWLEGEAELARWLTHPELLHLARLVASIKRRRVLASCSGVCALARAGILDGVQATTTWWLAHAFRQAFPRVLLDPSRALIVDRKIATAGAVFAQADLALHLVRSVAGPELARQVTRYLLIDERRGQPSPAIATLVADDELLRAAERWAMKRLEDRFDVPALARAVGASPRTLARRTERVLGTSPGQWVRRMRVEEAARLLQTSSLPITRVAESAGLGSVATLRRETQLAFGLSPRALRESMRAR